MVKDNVVNVCILLKDLQHKLKACKKFSVISLTNPMSYVGLLATQPLQTVKRAIHCKRGQTILQKSMHANQPVAQIRGRQRLRSSCAFPVAAAKAWNSLPAVVTSARSLQTFKSKLKTHLCSASFL